MLFHNFSPSGWNSSQGRAERVCWSFFFAVLVCLTLQQAELAFLRFLAVSPSTIQVTERIPDIDFRPSHFFFLWKRAVCVYSLFSLFACLTLQKAALPFFWRYPRRRKSPFLTVILKGQKFSLSVSNIGYVTVPIPPVHSLATRTLRNSGAPKLPATLLLYDVAGKKIQSQKEKIVWKLFFWKTFEFRRKLRAVIHLFLPSDLRLGIAAPKPSRWRALLCFFCPRKYTSDFLESFPERYKD